MKWSVLIVGIGAIAFSLIIIFLTLGLPVRDSYAKSVAPVTKPVAPASRPAVLKSDPSLPVRLMVPQVHIDAAIEQVGLTADGSVDVPKGHNDVAWFKLSPRPGASGNAVLIGHYGVWKNGQPTVFNNLSKLRQGDKIYVKDGRGVITTFLVRESKTYGPTDEASAVFIANDGKAHLNLVTCQGAWDKVSKSYPRRLVIFADAERR